MVLEKCDDVMKKGKSPGTFPFSSHFSSTMIGGPPVMVVHYAEYLGNKTTSSLHCLRQCLQCGIIDLFMAEI